MWSGPVREFIESDYSTAFFSFAGRRFRAKPKSKESVLVCTVPMCVRTTTAACTPTCVFRGSPRNVDFHANQCGQPRCRRRIKTDMDDAVLGLLGHLSPQRCLTHAYIISTDVLDGNE